MDTDREILETLREMRQSQQAMLAKQEEALAFLRTQAEHSTRLGEEAIQLQRVAVERARKITWIAVPGILLCVFLIVYLSVKYRIF